MELHNANEDDLYSPLYYLECYKLSLCKLLALQPPQPQYNNL